MRVFNFLGDTHGRNSIGTPSLGGHHRPIDNDFGFTNFSGIGVLDNVGPDVGACIDSSDIRDFCVCSSQSERKER